MLGRGRQGSSTGRRASSESRRCAARMRMRVHVARAWYGVFVHVWVVGCVAQPRTDVARRVGGMSSRAGGVHERAAGTPATLGRTGGERGRRGWRAGDGGAAPWVNCARGQGTCPHRDRVLHRHCQILHILYRRNSIPVSMKDACVTLIFE